jgi:hypothetical protein
MWDSGGGLLRDEGLLSILNLDEWLAKEQEMSAENTRNNPLFFLKVLRKGNLASK